MGGDDENVVPLLLISFGLALPIVLLCMLLAIIIRRSKRLNLFVFGGK